MSTVLSSPPPTHVDLDFEVAKDVMGWKLKPVSGNRRMSKSDYAQAKTSDGWEWDGLARRQAREWRPTRNMEQALDVVSKLAALGFSFKLSMDNDSFLWTAEFESPAASYASTDARAGEAICRAAVRAV